MDRVAAAIGLEPDDLRRRNFITRGQVSAVGQVMREPIDMPGLLDRALAVSGFREKRARFASTNPHTHLKKGIGISAFMHGAGFTGSGEAHLSSVASVEASSDGRFRVLAASTEIGQGTKTIFAQIAADALGVDCDSIDVAQPDTRLVPDSGPTVASRTCMIVGKLVEAAALNLRETLVSTGLLSHTSRSPDDLRRACAEYLERYAELRGTAQYVPPPGIRWDDATYQGDAYSAYAWAVYVAEVTVDPSTCEIRLDDFVAVQEVGKVINPVLATGQIEGGVAQAIGWALYEQVAWRNGGMVNGQMTNYIMPTSVDLPPIRVFFEEGLYSDGPSGAKGIGELPMDGPAPAIVNAVAHATRTDPRSVPLLPERLLDLLHPAGGEPPVLSGLNRP
jgi:CO/xanthine dehydrogenase Mo-binding subunit